MLYQSPILYKPLERIKYLWEGFSEKFKAFYKPMLHEITEIKYKIPMGEYKVGNFSGEYSKNERNKTIY